MPARKRTVLAGGTGFLGGLLSRHSLDRGHEPVMLTRSRTPFEGPPRRVRWDGRTLGPWVEELEGAMPIVNLAGRSVNLQDVTQGATVGNIVDFGVLKTYSVADTKQAS